MSHIPVYVKYHNYCLGEQKKRMVMTIRIKYFILSDRMGKAVD